MSKTIEELAKEARREYMRKWRNDNKEKVKKHNADYWKRTAKKKLEEENS